MGLWELHCAPSTWVVHYQAALCAMMHKGDLCPWEVGVTANIFQFLMGHKEHAKNGHYLSVYGGAQEHTTDILPGGHTPYMVHSAYINPSISIRWKLYVHCEAFTCMFRKINPSILIGWHPYVCCEAFNCMFIVKINHSILIGLIRWFTPTPKFHNKHTHVVHKGIV